MEGFLMANESTSGPNAVDGRFSKRRLPGRPPRPADSMKACSHMSPCCFKSRTTVQTVERDSPVKRVIVVWLRGELQRKASSTRKRLRSRNSVRPFAKVDGIFNLIAAFTNSRAHDAASSRRLRVCPGEHDTARRNGPAVQVPINNPHPDCP